ncbi:hypothetical protein LWI29_002462 [Acer saccharum]|uniref:Uncharacterized protein n=1 Tax=Acer saccharum TaxID=4024 RepID=A0AA39S9J2_ACESA|nr:hypothetical protein LWI29_002462 [Acer saccharum]
MVNSIRKRRKITGQQPTCDEGGTQSTIHVDPKLNIMVWINFHRQKCHIKTAEGSKKSMKEKRDAWNTLSMDDKSKYKMVKEEIVDDMGHLEEAAHEDNKVPPFDTRCTPSGVVPAFWRDSNYAAVVIEAYDSLKYSLPSLVSNVIC